MRRKLALCVVAALLVLAVAPISASAQAGGPQPTTQANSTATSGERIDADLRLVSSAYDGSGTATLVFEVDESKAVTLADAGGFVDGGHINRRTVVLQPGQHSVTFDVTESRRGYVGVSIATPEVLYAEVIRSPTPSPFQGASGTVGWLGGAGIVVLSFVGAALYKLRNEGGSPVEASP